jgi:hypothetical protein
MSQDNPIDLRIKFHCHICGGIYLTFKIFNLHQRLAHSSLYVCEVCREPFKNRVKLYEHQEVHYKYYYCNVCESKRDKYSPTETQMLITGSYYCSTCNISCKYKYDMRKHVRNTHSHFDK